MRVRICEGCGVDHEGQYGSGRFCSATCARGFSTKTKREDINRRVSARLKGRGPSKVIQEASRSHESKLKISDSLKVHYSAQRDEYLVQWKAGKLHPSEDRAKRLLIHERGEKCQKCGWFEHNPYSNTIPVELEHKDGDYKNNRYDNLELLCPNCHSLTPTFRGLNVGKGKGYGADGIHPHAWLAKDTGRHGDRIRLRPSPAFRPDHTRAFARMDG